MLAKTLGLVLFASTFTLSAFAGKGEDLIEKTNLIMVSEETCGGVIDNHMQLIEDSEEYFAKTFDIPAHQLKPHEITVIQKVLKVRFDHLMKVLAKFHSVSDCNLPNLGNVVAVYDFNVLAESTMKHSYSRKMLHSFTKAADYGMRDFKEQYNHFTRLKTIEDVRGSLTQQELGLLQMFNLKVDQGQDGTKLSTTGDALKRVWGWVLGKGLVRSWGMLSDNLKVRHGYLRDYPLVRATIEESLKPLDLLFEQRRFVLSNLTIPGHWGHTAVWLGTKKELQALGLWDREDFAVFKKQIELGKNIVQMRKEGVVFSSLKEFMNLDEIAVMRVNSAQINPAAVYPLMAEQLNKKYDFSFDATTLGKITCTEFVSFSFGEIAWPSRTQMGRTVIAPDDMAKLSIDSRQAHLVYYFGSDSGKVRQKTVKDWFNNFNTQK